MKHYTDGKLPYFDSSHLSDPSNSYVAWLDVMGTRAVMSRSLSMSATFICKLHVTAIEAAVGKNIRLYPVMDGLYVVANTRALISGFLETVFSRLADVFINESAQHHRFIVKAAIAYGPIIHGSDIGSNASWSLDEHAEYKRSILLAG